MKTFSYILLIALSCPQVSYCACYEEKPFYNIETGQVEGGREWCDDVSVNTITQEDGNGDTTVSAVMGGNSKSDCSTRTEVTINGADAAYDASKATTFSFLDSKNNKDSEVIDFSSNTENNDAYKTLCESTTVNGTYVTLTYEAICKSNTTTSSVYLYVYDQPRCYAQGCSPNDATLFSLYTIEPTVMRNNNDWSCSGDLDEDYARCDIYEKSANSQVDAVLEDQKYFFGLMTIKERKTVIPKVSEIFTSQCSEFNGTVNSLTGIVKCTKNGKESMAFDLDGSFPVCKVDLCDTAADMVSYFKDDMVGAGAIEGEYVCASSTDDGENWLRDNSHLVVIGVAGALAGICILVMIKDSWDENNKTLPTHKATSL